MVDISVSSKINNLVEKRNFINSNMNKKVYLYQTLSSLVNNSANLSLNYVGKSLVESIIVKLKEGIELSPKERAVVDMYKFYRKYLMN